jgi:Fur family ferric uptake transcriptional regulator
MQIFQSLLLAIRPKMPMIILATQLIFEYFISMSDHCNFPQWLAQEGLRATPVRLAVLDILAAAPRALRAQEILEIIRGRRRVNKVTVYRILEDFTRRGMVRKVSLEGRVSHFELACEHHPPHPHFQCQVCREVQCLEPVALEKMWSELLGPVGNRADHIEIRIDGLCHKCRDIS